MRRPALVLALAFALSPATGSACPVRNWCTEPAGPPTSAMAELRSAIECDTIAEQGREILTSPRSWLRLSRVARDFREVNEARDYAAQFRVRAARARSVAARIRKMRFRLRSALV